MNGLFQKKSKQRDGVGGRREGVENEDINFLEKHPVNLKFSLISKGKSVAK